MFTTKKQLDIGAICAGAGLLVYLILLQLEVPTLVTQVLCVPGFGISAWTAYSIYNYPAEKKEADINYNNLWGQSAMTLLWGACGYLAFFG